MKLGLVIWWPLLSQFFNGNASWRYFFGSCHETRIFVSAGSCYNRKFQELHFVFAKLCMKSGFSVGRFIGKMVGKPLGWRAPSVLEPFKREYGLRKNTHYIWCIWGWLLKGPPSQGALPIIFPIVGGLVWLRWQLSGSGHPSCGRY